MQPPVKDQTDIGIEDQFLDASSTEQDPDMTRQEFKDEADINTMLSKFGVTAARGTPVYGEWDDTIDLQSAIASVREAKAGYNKLPKELRDKFTSMEEMLTAVNNGSLVIKDAEPPAADAPPVPPA